MKFKSLRFQLLAAAAGVLGLASPLLAQNSLWTGASGTDTNWSNALNWSPNGVPGALSNVFFGNGAAGVGPLTNNVVDADTTVASLNYTNNATGAGNYQGTLIASGRTLTAANGLTVGGNSASASVANALIAGAATLSVSNSFLVQQGFNGDGGHQAILDLSGLDTFRASVNKFAIGFYSINNASRASGVLYLARTNFITVLNSGPTSFTNSFIVDWNPNSGGNNVADKGSAVYLGQTNVILADAVEVGANKSGGNTPGVETIGALLAFNPNGLNNPTVYFRNKDGVSRVSYWGIGDDSGQAASNQGASGTNDFTGGKVDAMITSVVLGATCNGNNTGSGNGTLTYNLGTIDALNVTNGLCLASGTSGSAVGTGTINVNDTAVLKVNNVLALAVKGSGTAGVPAQGTLNANGTVIVGSIVSGGGASTVNLVGGTLSLTNGASFAGTLANPIGTFSVSNTVLNVAVSSGVPIETAFLTLNAPATVNISALPVITSFPAQLPIIQYGSESGDLTTISLGTLPTVGAVPYKGYLTNNTGNFSVDLVVTNGFLPVGVDVWTGTNNANWDLTSPNWSLFGSATLFINGANVQFDDSAAGATSVNLVGNLVPSSLTVSNNTKNYIFGGSGSLGGTISLVKNGTGTLTITNTGNNTFSGGIFITNGTVQFGNGGTTGNIPAGTPTILDNGSLVLSQNSNLTITNGIFGTGSLVQSGTGVLSLSGSNSYAGQTLVRAGGLMVDGFVGGLPASVLTNAPGSLIGGTGTNLGVFNAAGIVNPGDVGAIGTLTTANGLTVYSNATLTFDLNNTDVTPGNGINDLLQVTGNVNANTNAIAVNLRGGFPQLGLSYPVLTYSGVLNGGFNPVVKSHFGVAVDTSTANQVNLIITGTNGATLKWNSTSSSAWDLGGAANWFNFGTSAADFFGQADSVLFDDSVAGVQTNITIATGVTVYPSAMTNISSANNYTISGNGGIGGPASLIKGGTSTLTISTTNSFTGGATILNGVVKAGSGTALGLNSDPTITNIIASGATLDENGQNMGQATFLVSGDGVNGQGAIINSGPDQSGNTAFRNIVLAGDTTFGGPGNAAGGGNTQGRWDMRGGTPTLVCLNGNAYNLTKVGSNQVTLVGVTVDPALANIIVKGGVFGVQAGVSSLGNPTNVLTLYSNTLLHCAGFTTALNKVINMTNATIDSTGSGGNEFDGPVTMTGLNTFNLSNPLLFTGGFYGPGSLTKSGGSTLTMSGTNSYTGNTVLSAGSLILNEPASLTASASITFSTGTTIDVNGRFDQSLELAGGHTLAGGGNINGSLTNDTGAFYFVGGARSIGTNVISNVATLLGTTYMDVTNNGARYDVIQGNAGVVLGGTLLVSNLDLAHPFTAGQSFQLFSGPVSGAFANIVPATPGNGLGWDTNSLVSSGTLNIISTFVPQPVIASTTVSGTNLVFSGTNGSNGGTYSVLVSTNIALPLDQWTTNLSSQFDGSGNFSVTNPIDPGTPQRFFLLKTP